MEASYRSGQHCKLVNQKYKSINKHKDVTLEFNLSKINSFESFDFFEHSQLSRNLTNDLFLYSSMNQTTEELFFLVVMFAGSISQYIEKRG